MYASYFDRSRDYRAARRPPATASSFWSARAEAELAADQAGSPVSDEVDTARVHAAFERLKSAPLLDLRVSDRVAVVPCGCRPRR